MEIWWIIIASLGLLELISISVSLRKISIRLQSRQYWDR